MRKIIWSFTLLLLIGFILYGSFLYIKDFNKVNTESDITGGKDIGKEEYIYKEELLSLGYTGTEIEYIRNKVSDIDVKNYLLSEKYENINKYVEIPYSKIKNIKRYSEYMKKNPTYSYDNIVLYVEIGIDNEFYTNITEITDANIITVLVNKYNKLPDKYEPDDLVALDSKYGSKKMREDAAEAFEKMADAAKEDGYTLKVVSGYRSEATQKSLFDGYVKSDSLKNALRYSAKPGYSEHQTGLAADINSVSDNFVKTKEYKWLSSNAYKYGFIERYPKEKEFITGYKFEPWHYRYLGTEITAKLYIENITYEEYIVKYVK